MNENLNRFCSKCGSELRNGSLFCGVCGNKVEIRQPNTTQMKTKKNNKKTIIIAATSILAVLIVLFVGISINNNSSNGKSGRTIMLYMIGSNLETDVGLGTLDLQGFNYQKLANNNTKLVAMIGGTTKWYNNYVDVDSTSIYELTSQGFQIVDKQQRKNMSDHSTLSYFLNYAYNNYKTKKYDLIVWDHGAGVLGAEFDDFSNAFRFDPIYLSEFKTAFSNSNFKGKNKLEAVFFRTCLNGTLEVASTLRDYADYMIASEEVTMGHKAAETFLKVFNEMDKNIPIKDFGKKFVDSYMDYINAYTQITGAQVYSTYSVIDLSKIQNVENDVNEFFKDINLNESYNTIARVRANQRQYGVDNPTYDSIDLYNFVSNLSSLSPKKANRLLSSLDDAIVYNSASNVESKGLSIYFPFNAGKDNRDYIINSIYDFSDLSVYKDFISNFNTIQSKGGSSIDFANNSVKLNTKEDKRESDFSLELTKEQQERFAKARYIVFEKDDEGYYSLVYSSDNTTLDKNVLKANIKDRQLVLKDTDGDTGNIYLNEVDENENYILYETSVVLEKLDNDIKMDNAMLGFALNKKTNKISISSLKIGGKTMKSDDIEITTPNNILANLNDYTHIAFVRGKYRVLDENGNYKEDWDKKGELFGYEVPIKDLELSIKDFSNYENYYTVFKIYDTNNNVYYSKLVKMGN